MISSPFVAFTGPDITQVEDCVEVWTDGSGSRKENAAGWAFVMRFRGQHYEAFGHIPAGTVNEAELTAIISTMEQINVSPQPLVIYTDSSYSHKVLTEWGPAWERADNWTTSTGLPAANRALVERGLQLIRHHERRRPVYIRWVRGHSGIPGNERADVLAGNARRGGLVQRIAPTVL